MRLRATFAALLLLPLAACGGGGGGAGDTPIDPPPPPPPASAYGVVRLINRQAARVTRLVVQSETNAANALDLSFPEPFAQNEATIVALRVDGGDRAFGINRVEYDDGLVVQGGGPGANPNAFAIAPGMFGELSLPPAAAAPIELLANQTDVVLLNNPTRVTIHQVRMHHLTEARNALCEPTGGWLPGATYAFPFPPGPWVLDSMDLGGLAIQRADAPVLFTATSGSVRSVGLPGFVPDDPLFANQWHLRNTIGAYAGLPGADANVWGAWATGFTGAGVPIAIMDDGLEVGHPDLLSGTAPMSSWHHDYVDGDANVVHGAHGTSVAGVAGARGGNSLGVTGVAPGAMLGGLRILGGNLFDSAFIDGFARGAGYVHNDSWGWLDPDSFLPTRSAILPGITTGLGQRSGLGVVYVMAAGNDREQTGDANLSGSHQHRGLILVGATQPDGRYADYSNPGANLLVSAPSSGLGRFTTTTDRTGGNGYDPGHYNFGFNGTSSATPVVAGVCALLLQANPNLSWRDVRTILARTAAKNDPSSPRWITNAAGRHFNHDYGFGVVDAAAAVEAARTWTTLSAETFGTTTVATNQPIADNSPSAYVSTVNFPNNGDWPAHIEYVEIQLDFGPGHRRARDLNVSLISPAGTKALLALQGTDAWDGPSAPESGDTTGASTLVLGATCFLDEPSVTPVSGLWTLHVSDTVPNETCTLLQWTIRVWGHN